MRSASLDQRDALGNDWPDLPLGEKLEERGGVLPEPLGMAVAELRYLERQDPLASTRTCSPFSARALRCSIW